MNEFCWFVLTDVNKVPGQNKIPLFREIYFFNQFSGDILFSFLLSFALFAFLIILLACLFFEDKTIYSNTHSTMRAGE